MTRLRPSTSDDHAFLRELHHRAYREVVMRQFGRWDEHAQDAWFELSLRDADVFVVELDGAAVGALAHKREPDCLHLIELQIAPEHQGQGLGSALLCELLGEARRESVAIRLRVLHENHRARHLYERHRFVVTGTTPTHYLMEWKEPVRQ